MIRQNVTLCLILPNTCTGLILKGAVVVSKNWIYRQGIYGFKRAVARSKSKASPPPHTLASLLQLPTRLLGPTCSLLDSIISIFPDQDFMPSETQVMTQVIPSSCHLLATAAYLATWPLLAPSVLLLAPCLLVCELTPWLSLAAKQSIMFFFQLLAWLTDIIPSNVLVAAALPTFHCPFLYISTLAQKRSHLCFNVNKHLFGD